MPFDGTLHAVELLTARPKDMHRLRTAFALVASLGLGVSVYLAWFYLRNEPVPCSTSFWHAGCFIVQESSYASLLGIPIPLWGIAYYLTAMAVALRGVWFSWVVRTKLLLLVTGGGFLFSLSLTFLEAFIIRAWCVFCVASALVATGLFVIAIGASRGVRSEPRPREGALG